MENKKMFKRRTADLKSHSKGNINWRNSFVSKGDEKFQNLLFFGAKFWFFELIFFQKLVNFPNCEIPKNSILKNYTNFQFGKFQKISIWKIPKISNLENSINVQFEKFQKNSIWKFGNYPNFKLGKFQIFQL